jgi:TRAP-type C4-dicarboxylate transport system substrate-binding protein
MSKRSYDRLNDAQKKALMTASKKAEDFFAAESKKLDDNMVEAFKKAGVKVVEMTDAQAAMWRDVANNTSYRTFAEKVPNGKALIVKALQVR